MDTKPAFQNLRQLVESTVNKFLSKQEWTPEMNKNQLREKMRKHIIELNFLEAGVERIVDQVVNPKVLTVFRPNIEEMVYKHLGIEQPKEEKLEPPGLSDLCLENAPCLQTPSEQEPPPPPPGTENVVIEDTAMLPTDLEAVSSPDSNNTGTADNSPQKEEAVPPIVAQMEVDDEDSPPFEPIEVDEKPPLPPLPPPDECAIKTESQETDISGLTSQDSIESEHEMKEPVTDIPATTETLLHVDEIKVESANSIPALESSPVPPMKDDSQLSQVSSDTQNSLKFDHNTSTEEPLKMDISEEAQMPIQYPVAERNSNNEVLTSFDLQKEAITFEQVKRENEPSTDADKVDTDSQPSITNASPPPPPPPAIEAPSLPPPPGEEPPKDIQIQPASNICTSGEVNKIMIKAVPDEAEESLDSADSMDLKIVETDSRGSVSASNQSNADTRDSKKDDRSRSSSHRSHNDSQHRSSSSSQHRSGNKSSSRDKDKDKERSRHRSRDHYKSDRSKSRKESDRKRDKEREKEKKNGDSCREQGTERRSTDRDSNDGANSGNGGGGSLKSSSNGANQTPSTTTSSNQNGSSPKARDNNNTTSGQTEKAKDGSTQSPVATVTDPAEVSDRVQQPIIVDQFLDGKELNLQIRVPSSPTKPPLDSVKLMKKPKIADNLKEAMKLMKVRKMIDLQRSKQEENAAVKLRNQMEMSTNSSEDGETSLHYFPEDQVVGKFSESASEKWWNHVKAQNEKQELVNGVKTFLEGVSIGVDKKDEPPKKRMKVDDIKTTEVITKKPINGLTRTEDKKPPTKTTSDFVDMDDYHEAEILLDDLPVAAPPLTENNNVQTENKNYGLTFNKLG